MAHDVAIPAFSSRLSLRFGGLVLPGENLPVGPGAPLDEARLGTPAPAADMSNPAPSGVPSGSGGREAALARLLLSMQKSARRHARNAGRELAQAEAIALTGSTGSAYWFKYSAYEYHHGVAIMASADAAELARVLG